MSKRNTKFIFWGIALVIAGLILWGTVFALKKGILSSQESFTAFIESCGVFAPLVFVVIETITVVILILPCMLGYPVSTAAFGPFMGFVLNALSTILGSLIIFAIVRKWGKPIVDAIVSKKDFKKYERFMEHTKLFERLLAAAFILPFFPDNALCYIAGLTDIKFKRFAVITVLFKPWTILGYTYGSQFFLNKFGYLWSDAIHSIGLMLM